MDRISISKLEVDIVASFILNRLQINRTSKSEHENPGIASIWSDERARRSKLKLDDVQSLEVPTSQTVIPTESDLFHRKALQFKLEQSRNQLNETNDQTLLATNNSETVSLSGETIKKAFNLKQFLSNSIYPAECLQNSKNISNASTIHNHLSDDTMLLNQSKQNLQTPQNIVNTSIVPYEPCVDEEIIWSLSQKSNLNETCK